MLTNQIKPDSNRQTTSGASPWVAGLVVAVSMLAVLLLGASGTLAQWGAGNAVEWNVKADDDTSFSMSITGTGDLSQFKQVVFSDLAPSGGLLAGPISLTLAGDVTAGERIRLVLESNPSTGYRWEIAQMNRAQLGQVGDTAFEPKSNLLGAPAKQMFSIQATQDGHTHLTLVYRRPWDKDSLPTRDITILASRLSSLSDLSNPAAPLMRVETPKPDITSERPSAKLVGLPSAFDWRTTGKVTAVRNQASCGSCWAFGTVAPFESSLLIKQSQTTDFSEQYLVSCNREGWGCDGGWWAHDYHISTYYAPETQAGGVPESAFPYTAQDTSCGGPYSHPNRLTRWRYVGDSSSVPTSDAIKQAIYTYGPVAVAVCVGNAFQAYTDGIFATGETSSCWGGINHAVTLVGWNDTDQYWIMKNSWGADWGENGYMRIRWGTSNIGYSANYVDDTAPTPPSNDDFNNATSVSALPYNVSQDVGDATVAQDDPTLPCVSAQKSNTVWYRYTPSQSGVLTVDTLGSNYDTVLAVWSGARGSLNSLGFVQK